MGRAGTRRPRPAAPSASDRAQPPAGAPAHTGEVEIRGSMIRLGQVLKLAGVVASGAEAKLLLEQKQVTVNGRCESRRGRQLHDGDRVTVAGEELRVRAGLVSGGGPG